MGSYLVCDHRENNSKVISGLMADIIREVIGDYNSGSGEDWLLTKEDMARLVEFTDLLIQEDGVFKGLLRKGLEKDKYWANSWIKHPDLYGERVMYKILSDFSVALARLILYEDKWIYVHWV